MMNPSASSVFLVQLICFLVFLPLSQCSSQVFFPMDENLLEDTCRKTPNYDICLYLLKFNGGSGIYSANRTRTADVMIDVVGLRATDALNKVKELFRKTRGARPIMICSAQYAYVVPNAKRDVYVNPQAAGNSMHIIPDMVEKGCEDAFRESPTLIDFNLGVEKVVAIAEAIIGQLS